MSWLDWLLRLWGLSWPFRVSWRGRDNWLFLDNRHRAAFTLTLAGLLFTLLRKLRPSLLLADARMLRHLPTELTNPLRLSFFPGHRLLRRFRLLRLFGLLRLLNGFGRRSRRRLFRLCRLLSGRSRCFWCRLRLSYRLLRHRCRWCRLLLNRFRLSLRLRRCLR